METRANHVAVGAFVLAMVVLAFVAVMWLARGTPTQYAHYDIYFQGPVTGLRKGASVEYSGVPVGKVADVRIDPANVERIRVTVEIEPDVAIKTDATASVETNILSGVALIQIVGGTQSAELLRAHGDERYPVIHARRSGLASVAARAPQLLDKLSDTAERINQLLDDKNRRAFTESLENVRVFTTDLAAHGKDFAELTTQAKTAATALAELIGHVDRSYSGPDGLGKELATTVGDFDRVARNLADTNRQLQLALQDLRPGLRTFGQQTLGDVGSLVAEARQLVSGLRQFAAALQHDPSSLLLGDRREGYHPR